MFTYLMFIAIFLCFLHFCFKYGTENVRLIRKLPCPEETFCIGNLATIIWLPPVQIFKLGRRLANKYKDIYGWWAFFLTGVNILNPGDIEIVTAGNKHSEKGKVYGIVEPWLKEGLLLSNGQKWQQRRKILTPAFHFNILKRYYVVLEENGRRLLDALDKTKGEPIDIIPVISEYTLSSICETAMGTALHEASSGQQYKNSIYKLGSLFVQRFARLHLIPNITFRMSSIGRNTYKELSIVQGFTKKVITERREFIKNNNVNLTDDNDNDDDEVYLTSKKKKIAMLDLLLLGQKEGVIDEAGVQEEVDTFMFEGHDTTAAGLTYCLMLLANHKEIQVSKQKLKLNTHTRLTFEIRGLTMNSYYSYTRQGFSIGYSVGSYLETISTTPIVKKERRRPRTQIGEDEPSNPDDSLTHMQNMQLREPPEHHCIHPVCYHLQDLVVATPHPSY
ncbi:cytochrome P450 4C1-like [Hyposmocoma kahamanoa]|uniref:cytochrome P450 4C1-like n=1 Tax=Hyposmocoma kahamanoa TaxID=1477025 RepID=UPI000E6D7108|nr:cytochrome P450 4C1-like [Hyposmocoma kahamanoa]